MKELRGFAVYSYVRDLRGTINLFAFVGYWVKPLISLMDKIFIAYGVVEKNEVVVENLVKTYHWEFERDWKHDAINRVFVSRGKCLRSFLVDRGHWRGMEIHNVFSSGVVVIQNAESRELVTEIICSPFELRRYWNSNYMGYELDSKFRRLVEQVRSNTERGLNNNDTLKAICGLK